MTLLSPLRGSPPTNWSRAWACLVASSLLALSACATLPDTDALIARHAGQAARLETARGPISKQRTAAILARLKQNSGWWWATR
jgi:cardiolipin synthase